jgi:RecT family
MTQVTKSNETFSLTPRTLDEAMKYSEMLARSTLVPKNYQGKASDILIAVQMGIELGLKPIQSLQNIAVINGKPCIYGDVLMSLTKIHPEFEDIREYFDEKLQAAICEVKRRGQTLHTTIFAIEDAKKAGLWNKPGPWTQYPKRMLQMRARGFALRDTFPDALQGLILAEEAMDYKDITPGIPANDKTYNSTSEKLIDKLSTTPQEEPVVSKIETAEIEPEVIVEPMPTLAEQLTILMSEKNIPIEVMQKWLKASGATKISEMAEDELEKCIKYVNEKY